MYNVTTEPIYIHFIYRILLLFLNVLIILDILHQYFERRRFYLFITIYIV